MNKSILLAIIIGAIIIIGGGYLLFAGKSQNTNNLKEAQEIKEFTVTAREFGFDPKTINIKSGDKIRIVLNNIGTAPHNLMIEGLDIGTKTISNGNSDVLEFLAPSAGDYTFFCAVGNHRGSGMEGKLMVEN